MDQQTVSKLNELNQKFYSDLAEDFSESRNHAWPGWSHLVANPKLQVPNSKLKVLDVGCGNGRFAEFLKALNVDFEYTGIDFSEKLIDLADKKLKTLDIEYKLEVVDLLNDFSFDQKFDLIVLFGVLHHIPGHENRKQVIRKLENQLDEKGILAVTVWQFPLFDRFEKKVLSLDEILEKTGIDPMEFEKGDYILDWFRNNFGFRYSHYTDREEMMKLLEGTELKITQEYEADGREENINKYYILQKT